MAGWVATLTRGDNQRKVVFTYTVVWLVTLAWTGWLVTTGQKVFDFKIPDQLSIIPSAVPWYGALGGVLISLVGVHEHRYDWDRRYWTWYVARPMVGAFVAVVAVLIFQSGVLAIGVNPDEAENRGPKDVFYYVIAFATGYREDAFRDLLRKVVDILFTSNDSAVPPVLREVDPKEGPSGTPVALRGSGFTGVRVVRFGAVDVEGFKLSETAIETTVPDGVEVGAIDITVAGDETSVTRSGLFKVTEAPEPTPDPDNPTG
jgi:hypothetical protein